MNSIPQFLIAAPSSGSGKTTVSRGLMALLTRKGLKVQPFKCGPDYIDTKYHTEVCGRPSVNLDTFMASPAHVSELYAHYAEGADACVVEGMMGMYDGYDRDKGSSAEIAALLHLPVVLVVDAKSAAYSMAPLLSGFLHFRQDVQIAGVIFNRVGSPRHYEILQDVCKELNVTCLGYLPKHKSLEAASRYLGLDFSQTQTAEDLELLTGLLEQYVDWNLLLAKTTLPVSEETLPLPGETGLLPDNTELPGDAEPLSGRAEPLPPKSHGKPRPLRILVARNEESFTFLYQEHLDILRRLGTVYFFDPECNRPIRKTDLLYLPGGYPEKHLRKLGKAWNCRSSIQDYVRAGGKVLAECGGMMYLAEFILPIHLLYIGKSRKLTLGYRQFDYNGLHLRGHEFHYTQLRHRPLPPPSVAQVYNAKGQPVDTSVFRYKNVIASYTHLYWGEINPLDLFK